MTIRIVTDSTSDISQNLAKERNIIVVPLNISFGSQSYLDGVEIDGDTFYRRLTTERELPKTSTPNVAQFETAYRQMIHEGADGIVSIHVSGALSGTHNTASLAARNITEETHVPIQVIDSRTVSIGLGHPALALAQAAAQGASIDDLTHLSKRIFDNSKLFFILDTLDYLDKGGRIGHASAVLGSLLQIKPILTIQDGIVTPLERIRTRAKALAKVADMVKTAQPFTYLGIASSDVATEEDFRKIAKEQFSGAIETFQLGAVVGTYAGPHAAGLYLTTD